MSSVLRFDSPHKEGVSSPSFHICYVDIGYPHPHGGGGAGTYIQLVGRELVRRGHRVSVVTAHCDQCPAETEDEGVQVFRPKFHTPLHYYLGKFPVVGKLSTAARSLEHGYQMYGFIEEIHCQQHIDVVEFPEGGDFWHGWRRNFPIVSHLHGSRFTVLKQSQRPTNWFDWQQRRLDLAFIQRADFILSPSQALLNIVSQEAGGLRPETAVIPLPIDPMLFDDYDEKTEPPLRVLFAARNDRVKGADILLQAIPFVLKHVPDVEFLFFGFRPRPGQAISERAIIHPFVPRAELLTWYQSVDICVVPSLWENSPTTIKEAMASGVAVVASCAGGIPELIEDGETGLLVKPNDVEGLQVAITRLLLDEALRNKLGRAAKTRAFEMFSLTPNVDQRELLYLDIIARKESSPMSKSAVNGSKMILDLGCGQNKVPGTIGVDNIALPGVDIVYDLLDFPYPFENESVEIIYFRHVIEHFNLDDIQQIFAEARRILRPGGSLRIYVPHAFSVAAWIDVTHRKFFMFDSASFWDSRSPKAYYTETQSDWILVSTTAHVTWFNWKRYRLRQLDSFFSRRLSQLLNWLLSWHQWPGVADLMVKSIPIFFVEIQWDLHKREAY